MKGGTYLISTIRNFRTISIEIQVFTNLLTNTKRMYGLQFLKRKRRSEKI